MLRIIILCFLDIGAWAFTKNDIMKTPHITNPTVRKISYRPKAEFHCRADGTPEPSYRWRNFKSLTVVEKNNAMSFDETTGIFSLTGITFSDERIYVCEAFNVLGCSWSAEITIFSTGDLGFFKDSKSRTNKSVALYSHVSIPCNYDGEVNGNEDIQYHWIISGGDDLKLDQGRMYVDTQGTLHYTYVEAQDEIKKYIRCKVAASRSDVTAAGPGIMLSIDPKKTPLPPSKPTLVYSNSGVAVWMGFEAKLECVFGGHTKQGDVIKISWKDPHHNVIQQSEKYNLWEEGKLLKFEQAQETDEGIYYCQAENSLGKSTEAEVELNIISPPLWKPNGQPKDQTKSEGSDVTFMCDAYSPANEAEPNTPEWFLNGEKDFSKISSNKFTFSDDKKKLTFSNIQKTEDYFMCIQCRVTNEHGYVWDNACLNVILPITVDGESEQVITIRKGDSIKMSVTAKTDPSVQELKYVMKFNGKIYTEDSPPPFMDYKQGAKEAVIDTGALTDDEYKQVKGVYELRIFHDFDETFVRLRIILDEHPDVSNPDFPDRCPNIRYYGAMCLISCPENCDEKGCRQVKGDCYGCSEGWLMGTSGICDQEVCTDPKLYGENCDKACSENCGDEGCLKHGGECFSCSPGWWHGSSYSEEPVCSDAPCLETGKFNQCSEKCPEHCGECDPATGKCSKCDKNWMLGKDEQCKEGQSLAVDFENFSTLSIGIFAGLAFLVLVGVILALLFIHKRKKKKDQEEEQTSEHPDSASSASIADGPASSDGSNPESPDREPTSTTSLDNIPSTESMET